MNKKIGVPLVLSSLALSAFSFLVLMNELVVPEGSLLSVLGAPLLIVSVIMFLTGTAIVLTSRRRMGGVKPIEEGEGSKGREVEPDVRTAAEKIMEKQDGRLVLVKRLVGLTCLAVFFLGVLAPYDYDAIMMVIVLLGSPVALVGLPLIILSLYLMIGGKIRRRDYFLGVACVLLAATMVPNPVLYMMEGAGNEYSLVDFTNFTYRIDSSVRIYLASGVPPSEYNIKTVFPGGETIYPQESGLGVGAYFAFRVIGPDGLPTNATGNAIGRVTGEGGMGWGTFNTPEAPLAPGAYKIEVVIVERGAAFVVSSLDFEIR